MVILLVGINCAFLVWAVWRISDVCVRIQDKHIDNLDKHTEILDIADKLYNRINSHYDTCMKDNAAKKKELVKMLSELEKSHAKLQKAIATSEKTIKKIDADGRKSNTEHVEKCKKIVHEAEEAVKNVGKMYTTEADKVVKWVRDIARDFYQLATVLKDGKIKEMAIISEKEYFKNRQIPNQ